MIYQKSVVIKIQKIHQTKGPTKMPLTYILYGFQVDLVSKKSSVKMLLDDVNNFIIKAQ